MTWARARRSRSELSWVRQAQAHRRCRQRVLRVGESGRSTRMRSTRMRSTRMRSTRMHMDERGAVLAEYAVVMVCVSLLVALAVGALGIPLFNLYAFSEAIIGLPFP